MRNIIQIIWNTPRNIAISTIILYQKTISLDHGPLKHLYPYGYCKHTPTCSEYCKQQLYKNGIVVGTIHGALRLLQCNPWTKVSEQKIAAYYSERTPKRTRRKS